jgi:hypothetical protein
MSADEGLMAVTFAFSIVLVILSAISARFFLSAIIEGQLPFRSPEYSRMALGIGRWYRILAWGVVTLTMLGIITVLFYEALSSFF